MTKRTCEWTLTAASLHTLISTIWTVFVPVTLPALGHTVRAGAVESFGTARLRTWNDIV